MNSSMYFRSMTIRFGSSWVQREISRLLPLSSGMVGAWAIVAASAQAATTKVAMMRFM